ncbi:ankyrin-1-like [Ptychodera flava]|uniref:ankyrin-1-like n=1 Tax=Ptychodera flava TaxID=63121 RepID=UPI003969E6EA
MKRESSNLSQLLWVVARYDEQMTGDIVKCDVDINDLKQDGIALLHHFAKEGDEKAVGILTTALHWAVSNNLKTAVKTLMNVGHDINEEMTGLSKEFPKKTTLLHYLSRQSSIDALNLALEVGADCHLLDEDSKTAFFYAVHHEQIENVKRLKMSHASFIPHLQPDKLEARTVYDAASNFGTTKYLEVLLKSGYRVDATDIDGTTPLHLASKENKEEAIVHLVNHGAIVDILDKNQRTAIHHAVLNSNFEATRVLLRNNSKTDLADVDQKTPLYIALELKDQQIVRELLDVGSTIHLENERKSNVSQVYWAAKHGKKSMVNTLHKCGVNMDGEVVVEEGKTPLHLASAEGSEETVQILLENGANVDVYCKKGLSPLFYASYNKHNNVTQRLLNQTNKIHKDCAPEMTHLHWAVREYYPDVAKTLAGAGLDINGEVYDRSTILHREIRDNELEVIQLCVELEADIHKEDREKRTPLFYAIRNDKVENAKFLLGLHANFLPLSEAASVLQEETGDVPKWSVSQQPIYLAAAKYKEKSFVDNLKKAGKNINDAFQDGLTAIHVAAVNNETKAVEILMECGADVNKQDEQGWTALHHAVVKRNNDVVEVLISNIATTKDAVNKNGNTALYCAAERSFHDTAELLLRNQCKIHPDAFGIDNNAQLHWALKNGHRHLVSVLKDAGVDINSYVQRGMTSLHILSEEGDDRGVEILLDYGADINKFLRLVKSHFGYFDCSQIMKAIHIRNVIRKKQR